MGSPRTKPQQILSSHLYLNSEKLYCLLKKIKSHHKRHPGTNGGNMADPFSHLRLTPGYILGEWNDRVLFVCFFKIFVVKCIYLNSCNTSIMRPDYSNTSNKVSSFSASLQLFMLMNTHHSQWKQHRPLLSFTDVEYF